MTLPTRHCCRKKTLLFASLALAHSMAQAQTQSPRPLAAMAAAQETSRSAAVNPMVTRDPFQVTPELRKRQGGNSPFSPAVPVPDGFASDGDIDTAWVVKALMLGPQPLAVLVHRGDTAQRGRAAGGGKAGAARENPRYVRLGEMLDMPDGRNFKVMRIDRQGVQLLHEGAENDWLMIR